MPTLESRRVKWVPSSEEDRAAIMAAMEEIVASHRFRNSKRYPTFLHYIVAQSLNGDAEQLKERTIGIEVFGRAPDYDTNLDTIVRYTAGEVRKRLVLYYSTEQDASIQIHLSAGSYQPEFYRTVSSDKTLWPSHNESVYEESSLSLPTYEPVEPVLEKSLFPDARVSVSQSHTWNGLRKLIAGVGAAFLLVLIFGGQWLWQRHEYSALNRFWSPVISAKGPVLICPGGVVLVNGTTSGISVAVAQNSTAGLYVSFESSLAIGRISSLFSLKGSDYRVVPSALIKFDRFRESAVVLIGAYNNEWVQRMLQPLRFRFRPEPDEGIVDAQDPKRTWMRSDPRPTTEKPDYAIVARFRDPSTDSIVVVIAGLKRYGTDAASQFVVSSDFLKALDKVAGAHWNDGNIEVVLRTDVENGSAGIPIIQAVYVWK